MERTVCELFAGVGGFRCGLNGIHTPEGMKMEGEQSMEEGHSMEDTQSGKPAYALLKKKYNGKISEMKQQTDNTQSELHALFAFAEEAFGEGNEMLILVTELTRNSASARFLGMFGSPDYARHSESLMLAERRADILARMEQINQID